jgi:hypothetical protein
VQPLVLTCCWCGGQIEVLVEDDWATVSRETALEHEECVRRAVRAAAAREGEQPRRT